MKKKWKTDRCRLQSVSSRKKQRFRDENINMIEKGFDDGYNFEDEKSLNESPKDGDESRYVTFNSDINVLMYISHHS